MTGHDEECDKRFAKVVDTVDRLEQRFLAELHKLTQRLDELDARTRDPDDAP